MITILTSHIGGAYKVDGKRLPGPIADKNGLLAKLKDIWPADARVLMICADPVDYEKNDSVLYCYKEVFPMSGLSVSSIGMCDARTEAPAENISETDVIILTGGHVPTQNAFFKKIGLREKLKGFEGILIAWSAGSMNCADTVYAGPELEGEALDPAFKRWIPGLGLTRVNIFPHYEMLKDDILDGLRVIEDITYADSLGQEILALNDGSYIVIEDGRTELFGEAYSILDGEKEQICRDGEKRSISEMVLKMRQEIVDRSNRFEEQTKDSKDEYNIYREHIRHVYKYVVKLSEGKAVDREVLEISALLHDIAMTDMTLDRSRHNEYGADIAEQLLRENGYPEDKIRHVKNCILNHSSRRAEFRTTEEEQILVNADGLSHFDAYKSLYSLAHRVMGLNDEDSLKFIQDKLTKDYNELSDELKYLVSDIYSNIMKAGTIQEIINSPADKKGDSSYDHGNI